MSPKHKFDRPRVFDVSHPHHNRPSETSRPIIVGHRPQPADPMVRHRPPAPQPADPEPTTKPKIVYETTPEPTVPVTQEAELEQSATMSLPEPKTTLESETLTPAPEPILEPEVTEPHPELHTTPPTHEAPITIGHYPQPTAESANNQPHPHDYPKGRWWVWVILILLGAFIGVYLAIDSGLLKSSINLPFHIFKQDNTNIESNAPASVPLATVPTTDDTSSTAQTVKLSTITLALPSGFTASKPNQECTMTVSTKASLKDKILSGTGITSPDSKTIVEYCELDSTGYSDPSKLIEDYYGSAASSTYTTSDGASAATTKDSDITTFYYAAIKGDRALIVNYYVHDPKQTATQSATLLKYQKQFELIINTAQFSK